MKPEERKTRRDSSGMDTKPTRMTASPKQKKWNSFTNTILSLLDNAEMSLRTYSPSKVSQQFDRRVCSLHYGLVAESH